LPNDVRLQEGHPVDENLRPLKVGGKSTAIETAQHGNGARVNGDLIVTGEIKGKTDIQLTDDITCDDIACDDIACDDITCDDITCDDITCDEMVIDKNYSDTIAATIKALHVDLDRTGDVSTGTDASIGIDLDVDSTGSSGGYVSTIGMDIDIVGDRPSGFTYSYGVVINTSGTQYQTGLSINTEDTAQGADINIASSANSLDNFKIKTIEDGETTLTTVENGVGSTAHLNMVVDGDFNVDAEGDIILDSHSGITKFYDAGDITEYTSLTVVGGTGAATLQTYSEAADGHLSLDIDGNILLRPTPGGSITLQENDGTGYTPSANSDATTKRYVDSVMYDHRVCNYNSSSTMIQYVPLAGYIIEGSTANSNEYRAMVMPYDGSLIRIIWRSETEQTSGNFNIQMMISSDGTEIPTTTNFLTRVSGFTLAANTTYVHDPGVTALYHASGNESNAFSKGQIIAVGIDPTVAPNDTNCTLVFKYDTST